ncbi:hypothetical protein [Goekera deserti]|uniref:hypothetical protein n=1 Tax=Goekera deserti TaxID=2497753 RepID=UPI00157704DE|nr:hypothetical protein [Goekera deserti]
MTQDDPRTRYRNLPEPVRPADVVESVDTRRLPDGDPADARERVLLGPGAAG